MAETAWTEDEPPPKKKSIPTWVWFCGAGCLAAVILGVIGIGLGVAYVKKAIDPEKQWEHVARILPYDERPPEMHLVFGNQIGLEQYTFQDDRGFQVQIQRHKGADGAEARKKMFATEDPEFPQNLVVMKFEDLAPGVVEVQGRDVNVLRMRMEFSGVFGKMMPEEAKAGMGSIMFLDLTPEGDPGLLLVQFTRMKGEGPITDDEVRTLLKPFHVGPNR